MSPARRRLLVLLGALAALGVAVAVLRPVDQDGLRDAIDRLGWAAPLAYVPASALLGAVFVPGALLATVAGLLFGTWTGFAVTLAAAQGTALLALEVARPGGREGVEEIELPRVRLVDDLLRRHGTLAVVVARLLPAVPDAPCSYLFGLAALTRAQVALGTLVGAAPRGLSYTALGDGLGGGGTATAVLGGAGVLLTGGLGLLLAGLLARRGRASR